MLLYVEQDNTGAVGLYERSGFTRLSVDVSWRRTPADGPEASARASFTRWPYVDGSAWRKPQQPFTWRSPSHPDPSTWAP